MSEPTTRAGRALLDDLEEDPYALPDILAIEAKAKAQERKRLRIALSEWVNSADMVPAATPRRSLVVLTLADFTDLHGRATQEEPQA